MKSSELSKKVRVKLLEMNCTANASHSGSALSMVDIISVLYTDFLNVDVNNPLDEKEIDYYYLKDMLEVHYMLH